MAELSQNTLTRAGLTDPFTQRLAKNEARRGPLMKRNTQLSEQQLAQFSNQEGIATEQSAALDPVRSRMADKAKEETPALKQERAPDFQRPTVKPEELNETFGMLMAASMLVGLGSRAPFYGAMSAMTGAINGFMKQDAAVVRESMQVYDKNMNAMKERNAAMRSEVEDAERKKKNDLAGLRQEYELIAAKYDLPMTLATTRSKSITEQQKMIHSDIAALDKTDERLARDRANFEVKIAQMEQTAELRKKTLAMQQQRHEQRKGLDAPVGLTPGGEAVLRELVKAGKSIPRTRRGLRDDETLNLMGQTQEGGAGSGSIVGAQADYKAKSLALNAIGKDLTAIRPYKEMLEMNGNIAIDLAKKAIATNSKLANRPLNWVRQNVGDNPDVAEFWAQAQIVSTESARVLNNPRLVGQLTDSARHEMQGIISGDMPFNSFERVVKRMQLDGQNRVKAMEKEQAALRKDLSGGGRRSTDSTAVPMGTKPDKAAVEKAGGVYQPDRFMYRYGPDGMVQESPVE